MNNVVQTFTSPQEALEPLLTGSYPVLSQASHMDSASALDKHTLLHFDESNNWFTEFVDADDDSIDGILVNAYDPAVDDAMAHVYVSGCFNSEILPNPEDLVLEVLQGYSINSSVFFATTAVPSISPPTL